MVEVKQQDDNIVFDVKGWHKLWALKSELVIPRSNILGARRDPAVIHGWKGLRAPGTHVPGIITAGTFYLDGQRIFWDVRDAENAVVIDLADESYQQLVIEVEDPDRVVAMLSAA